MKTVLSVITICTCLLGLLQPCLAGVEWSLKRQLPVDSAPVTITLSPDGKLLFVLTSGEVILYETKSDKVLNRIPLEKTFDSMTYSAADNTLFLSSRSDKAIKLISIETVYQFSFTGLPFTGPADAPVTIAVFSDYQ